MIINNNSSSNGTESSFIVMVIFINSWIRYQITNIFSDIFVMFPRIREMGNVQNNSADELSTSQKKLKQMETIKI